MIAYSYNARSYTYSGIANKKTNYSATSLVFLKKYMTIDSSALIFVCGKLLGEVTKIGSEMQIPIHSLNSKVHEQKNVKFQHENILFNIKNTSKIEIVTSSKAVAEFLGIECGHLGY